MVKKNLELAKNEGIFFTDVWCNKSKKWMPIQASDSLYRYIDFWGTNKDGHIFWGELKLENHKGSLYKGKVVKQTICNRPLRPTQKSML